MATFKRPDDPFDFMKRLDGVALTLAERSVLWAHYKFADKNGTNCRVGEERLAKYLSVDVRTIRRHRKTLRDKGWLIERERGRNVGDKQVPSWHEVVIPVQAPEATQKARRVPNPNGWNQHNKNPIGQDSPQGLQDTPTRKPSSLEDKNNRLPTPPKIDDRNRSSNPTGGEEDPWGAGPSGRTEDAWGPPVSDAPLVGTVVGCEESAPADQDFEAHPPWPT